MTYLLGYLTGDLLVGVFAEDVLNDHDGLLDNVVDLGLDEVQQGADTALCGLLTHTKGGEREGERDTGQSEPALTS